METFGTKIVRTSGNTLSYRPSEPGTHYPMNLTKMDEPSVATGVDEKVLSRESTYAPPAQL